MWQYRTHLGRYEVAGGRGKAGKGEAMGSGSGDEVAATPWNCGGRGDGGCGLEVGWAAPPPQGNWRS